MYHSMCACMYWGDILCAGICMTVNILYDVHVCVCVHTYVFVYACIFMCMKMYIIILLQTACAAVKYIIIYVRLQFQWLYPHTQKWVTSKW